uniref:Uncharacterized protein n=1 Tax=Cucumis melo TaxID=3656 RepID=A0A9I9DXF8_CUCME
MAKRLASEDAFGSKSSKKKPKANATINPKPWAILLPRTKPLNYQAPHPKNPQLKCPLVHLM